MAPDLGEDGEVEVTDCGMRVPIYSNVVFTRRVGDAAVRGRSLVG